jgi:hypothetical protein
VWHKQSTAANERQACGPDCKFGAECALEIYWRPAEGVCDLCVSVADYWLQTSLTRSLILSAGARWRTHSLIPIRRSEICEACLIRAGRRNALTSVKILLSTRISLALLGMVSAVRYLTRLIFYIL